MENLDALGQLIDTVGNYQHTLKMPLPSMMLVDAARTSLAEIKQKIQEIYLSEGGEKFWDDEL